jgi:DNA-binding beta-propeller fold protein YncE
VDPAANTVYAATRLADNVLGIAVIDGATNSITATVALAGATGFVSLAVDAATDTVYAGTQHGSLFAIDGATDAVTKSVQLSPYTDITGLAVDSARVDRVGDLAQLALLVGVPVPDDRVEAAASAHAGAGR